MTEDRDIELRKDLSDIEGTNTYAKTKMILFWRKNGLVLGLFSIIALILIWDRLAGGLINIEGAPEMDLLLIILLIASGLLAGWLGGLIGTGGCAIILPVLSFWLGYSVPVAVGTTLFAVVFTALSGGYGHYIQGNTNLKVVKWMAPAGVVGVLIGSWLFGILAEKTALICFVLGLVFLLPSFRMIYEGIFPEKVAEKLCKQEIREKAGEMSGFSLVVGTLTGLVGLGGGYLLVPGLIYLFGLPVYTTMGTSLATVFPIAVVGSIFKLSGGYVALDAALFIAAGTIIGAQISAQTIKKYKPSTLKLIFGLYFLYASFKFIYSYAGSLICF